MKKPKVDIGVACAAQHYPEWTSAILSEFLAEAQSGVCEFGKVHFGMTALPDVNKNSIVADPRDPKGNLPANDETKRRNDLTDSNRLKLARGFLQGDSDYIFMLDDDTAPPRGALGQLLSLQKDFVAGVYFLGGPPFNPIAYQRVEDGTYAAVYHYTEGELKQVDSVGMGCTLIHRSVFEAIQAGHTVFERPNGSLMPVSNKLIGAADAAFPRGQKTPPIFIANGYLHMAVKECKELDKRPWPFYALEYGRTEDHHFCELAGNVGIRPWWDTSVVCDHLKMRAIDKAVYKEAAKLVKKELPE